MHLHSVVSNANNNPTKAAEPIHQSQEEVILACGIISLPENASFIVPSQA
jgi:hypothetical protein